MKHAAADVADFRATLVFFPAYRLNRHEKFRNLSRVLGSYDTNDLDVSRSHGGWLVEAMRGHYCAS